MDIAPATLIAQYDAAHARWPFITDVERWCGLPPFLLWADASRETNDQDEIGDGGHGFGVFQRDNRYHAIPPNYLADVHQQAADAATLIVANFRNWGTWRAALAAYNSGQPDDRFTAGHDYAADVLERMACLISARAGITLPTMTPGLHTPAVTFFQTACNAKRFPGGPVPVTGTVDAKTIGMVRAFQTVHGLDVDGIAGPVTLAVMQACPMPHNGQLPAPGPGVPITR